MEASLTQEQVKQHFTSIDNYSSLIVAEPENAMWRFARALDFYQVQDFSSALDDLTQAILCDENFVLAYFCRSLIRCKQIEYRKATEKAEETGKSESKLISDSPQVLDYELICADLDKVIELAPDFGYAYYNRGNRLSQQSDYHAAIVDYSKAIEYNPNFAEAYYNRGLTYIFLGHNRCKRHDRRHRASRTTPCKFARIRSA